MQEPRTTYWDAVIRILRYLKKTPSRGLFYKKGKNPLGIQCFVDSNWAGSIND